MFVESYPGPGCALPRRSHPSVGTEIGSLQSFKRFTLQTFKQHVTSSRDEKSVTATPLFPSLTNCYARNSFRIRSYANCRVSLASSPNSQTLHVPLSSLAATLMDQTPQVLQIKDLRQTYAPAKPFRCNTYKKHGECLLWSYHITGTLPRLISFVCHSYENCRVCIQNSHSGTVHSSEGH